MRKLIYAILLLFIVSCFSDRDDFLGDDPDQQIVDDDFPEVEEEEEEEPEENPEEEEEPEQDDELTFVTESGEVYFTGLECSNNPDYFFSEQLLPEDLEIPEELSASVDLSNFLPPVGSQGSLGSCVSWAVTYYLKSYQEIMEDGEIIDSLNIISPAYTYNKITAGNCEGTLIANTFEILKNEGAAPLNIFPYNDDECATQPDAEAQASAGENKISDYRNLSSENLVEVMKTYLTNQQPIVIAALLDSEFGVKDEFGLSAYREHNVDFSNTDCHAMLVVGYNDEYNAFKIVNSWGTGFGDNGFVWIDYAAFENTANPDADFRVINEAWIAYDL